MTDTIVLSIPLQFEGREITEITLRRPLVRDRLAVDRLGSSRSDAEKEVMLIASLSGLPLEAIEGMDLGDYGRLQERLGEFVASRPPLSAAPS